MVFGKCRPCDVEKSPADITQTWDLFEGDLLFDKIFHAWGEYDPFKHLAPMVALLGPPPSEFVSRSETTEQRFGPDGKCLG